MGLGPAVTDSRKGKKKNQVTPLARPGGSLDRERTRSPGRAGSLPAARMHGKLILPLRDSPAAQHPATLSASTKKLFFTIRKRKSGTLPPLRNRGAGGGERRPRLRGAASSLSRVAARARERCPSARPRRARPGPASASPPGGRSPSPHKSVLDAGGSGGRAGGRGGLGAGGERG